MLAAVDSGVNSSVAFEEEGELGAPPTHKPAGCVPQPDVISLAVDILADVTQLLPS